jgi:hypothetical protein
MDEAPFSLSFGIGHWPQVAIGQRRHTNFAHAGIPPPKSWPRRPLGALLAISAIGGSWNDGCDGAATGMGDGGGAACGGIGIP